MKDRVRRQFIFFLTLVSLFLTSCSSKIKKDSQHVYYYSSDYSRVNSRTVIIDAGHGGRDSGARSCLKPPLLEKTVALRTAKLVSFYLKSWGYDVVMTRKTDIFIPLLDRVSIANRGGSRLFVSIHYNSAKNPSAEGVEIYFFKDSTNPSRTKKSELLGKAILKQMILSSKASSRGVLPGNFCVIRETKMAAVLVEVGFLSNPKEARKYKNIHYIEKMAYGIAKGVEEYVKAK